MATFKGLFKGKQVLVPMVLIKTLKDDSEKLTLMMYLIRKCHERNYYDTMNDDKTFDISLYDIQLRLYSGNKTFREIVKLAKSLEDYNIIKIDALYDDFSMRIISNFDYINALNKIKEEIKEEDIDDDFNVFN